MSGSHNLFRGFLSIFGGKVLTTITAILSTPIIARLLGPGGYGDYAVLLSIFSIYMIPISASITEGVQKFVAENRGRDNWREYVIRFYVAVGFVAVAIGSVILFVFTSLGYAERIFGDGFTRYFYLLVLFVLVSQFRAFSYHTVLGFGKEPISESLNVVKKVATVTLGIGLVVLGYGVSGMIVGHIVGNLLVAIAAGYVIVRTISVTEVIRGPDSFPYQELLSFNGLNIVLVLLVMSLFHVDVIMLRTFVDSDATGYYKAALSMAEFIWIVPLALQMLLLHSSSTLWSEGRTAEVTNIAARLTRYTVLLVVLLAVGLGALAHRVVPLYYGASFTAAVEPILLLLPGVIGFAVARPLQAICQGSGKIKILVIAISGSAFVNVLLNGIMIPLYGMNGAAIATSISYGSMFVFLVWASLKIGFNPLDDIRPIRVGATIALSAPVIVVLERTITWDVLALVGVPPIGALVFLAVAIGTGALDTEEVLNLVAKIPGPFDRFVGRIAPGMD